MLPNYYLLMNILVIVGSIFFDGSWEQRVSTVSAVCGIYTIFCARYLLQHRR